MAEAGHPSEAILRAFSGPKMELSSTELTSENEVRMVFALLIMVVKFQVERKVKLEFGRNLDFEFELQP